MTELTKLERLKEKVADTEAAYEAAFDAAIALAWEAATYAAWSKAKRELDEYLKEQQDND